MIRWIKKVIYKIKFFFAKTQYGFDVGDGDKIHYVGFKIVDGIYTVVCEGKVTVFTNLE